MKQVVTVVVLVIAVLVALPLINQLRPKPVTFADVENAFQSAGMSVEEALDASDPGKQASAERQMRVDGASVTLYRYGDRSTLSGQMETYQQDTGGGLGMSAWNMSEGITGSGRVRESHVQAARKGVIMLVVQSPDSALRRRIVSVFEKL